VEQLNVLDIAIIAVLILSIIVGYMRGFVKKLVSIASWFAAYLVAFSLFDHVAPLLQSAFPLSSNEKLAEYSGIVTGLKLDTYIYNSIAFALLFFGTRIALTIVGYFLQGVASIPGLSLINRWLGVLLGIIEAVVIIIIGIMVLEAMPSERIIEWLEQSLIVDWLHTHALDLASLRELLGR
jgi:uncharacterized membrane protein required for colicin V production